MYIQISYMNMYMRAYMIKHIYIYGSSHSHGHPGGVRFDSLHIEIHLLLYNIQFNIHL